MIAIKQRKKLLRPVINFIKYRVLHVDDSPHRIALGVSIGLFAAYLPPLGIHILAALILSFLLRANKFVAVTFVWLSNPFTFVFIYYPNYLMGRVAMAWLNIILAIAFQVYRIRSIRKADA